MTTPNAWTDEDVEIGLRAARANARREALEEAAKMCEAYSLEAWGIPEEQSAADCLAAAIRALDRPEATGGTMNATDFTEGQRVRYIPGHAHGDRGHPDCEDGTVSSLGPDNVRVRFDKQVSRLGWQGTTAQACTPDDLIPLS